MRPNKSSPRLRFLGLAFNGLASEPPHSSPHSHNGLIGEVQIVSSFMGLRQGPRWLSEVGQTMVLSGKVDQTGLAIGVLSRSQIETQVFNPSPSSQVFSLKMKISKMLPKPNHLKKAKEKASMMRSLMHQFIPRRSPQSVQIWTCVHVNWMRRSTTRLWPTSKEASKVCWMVSCFRPMSKR